MTDVLARFRLDGRVAIVTGGARGLGAAAARALAAAGARVTFKGAVFTYADSGDGPRRSIAPTCS